MTKHHRICAASVRLIGSSTPPICDKLKTCVTKDFSVWLLNSSDTEITVEAGELFGYNTGTFTEKPVGKGVKFKPYCFFGEWGAEGVALCEVGCCTQALPDLRRRM